MQRYNCDPNYIRIRLQRYLRLVSDVKGTYNAEGTHSSEKTRKKWPAKKYVKNSWSNFDLQTLANCDDMRP